MSAVTHPLPPLEDPIAPPRSNGEPVFEEPWQSRAFGMVVTLHQQGAFAWDDFRERLIAEVAAAEAGAGRPYYESWLAAFQRLAVEKGLLTADELTARRDEFATGARHDVY
jgi:nitrile hydratase accessory protein